MSMPFRTRVWSAGKLLVLAGALVATYLAFAYGAMRLALKAREVEVPDLTNRTANEATDIANGLGLSLKVDDIRKPDPKVPAGRVMAQEPTAGSTARSQRTVRIWLSAGEHAATAPLVVGETERAAQLRLSQDGIAGGVAEIRSSQYPPDVVVAQSPAPKTPTTQLSMLVNRGDFGSSYVMPDLIGINGDRAAEILRAQGFRVAVVASNPYPGVVAGVVLRQSPQGGFRIAPGEPISLEVSR
jgi:eukaryotic-like serine/threonine-protein kinase